MDGDINDENLKDFLFMTDAIGNRRFMMHQPPWIAGKSVTLEREVREENESPTSREHELVNDSGMNVLRHTYS